MYKGTKCFKILTHKIVFNTKQILKTLYYQHPSTKQLMIGTYLIQLLTNCIGTFP